MEPPFTVDIPLEELVINSLLLLGYEQFDIQQDMKAPLEPTLFQKYNLHRSNTKALETLLYFLLFKLAPEPTRKAFTCSWPPRTHDMKREFKEECFKLLKKLEYERKIPQNTLVGKSLLEVAKGERVWKLLKILSDSALLNLLPAEVVPPFPLLDKYLLNPAEATRQSVYRIKRAIAIRIHQQVHIFNKNAADTAYLQSTWVEQANFLADQHRSLRNKLDKIKKKLKQFSVNPEAEKLAALDRVPQMEMVQHIWQNIESLDNESIERKGEYSVTKLAEMQERPVLDGEGRLEVKVDAWTQQLKKIKANLNEKAKEGPVLDSLKKVIGKALAEHRLNLEKLNSATACFKQQIETLEAAVPLERHAVEKLRVHSEC